VITVLAGAALSASAQAHDERPAPGAIFAGIVQERDVDLVFDYLREALDAAAQGREAPPADAIARRAETIGEELTRRGAAAARVFVDAIEKHVREGLRERDPRPALPPSPSSRRI
jgi:hypothetical protein